MIFIQPQSVTALQITVTSTATSLYRLMDTAGGSASQKYYSDKGANAIIISPENGDIRWLVAGTPTATIGTKISQSSTLPIAGIDLSQMNLISTSGNVTVTVQLYKSEPGEGLALGGGGGSALSYDTSTDSDKVTVLNGDRTYYAPLLQEDVTSTSTAFKRYLDVEGVGEIVIQLEFTSGTGTFTIHASAENNGTNDASCSYDDITQFGTTRLDATAAANLTTGKGLYRVNCKGLKYIMIDMASPSSFVGSIYVNRAY